MLFSDLTLKVLPLVNKCLDNYGVYRQVISSVHINSEDFNCTFDGELSRQDIWKSWEAPRHLRSHYINGTSFIIDALLNKINNSFKENIISNIIQADPNVFNYHWKEPIDYYLKNSKLYTSIFYDKPGFEMSPHRDNHSIIGQYIINLNTNSTGTKFYEFDTSKHTFEGTGEKYKGVVFLNTSLSAHTIDNIIKDRYVLYISMLMPTVN